MKINDYKNLFLDRDGIINKVIMRGDTVSSPRYLDEFKLREDFIAFHNRLEDSLNLFVITNQPDIKRGLLKENDLEEMHELIKKIFSIKEIVYCPHDDEDKCICRKPKPGMIRKITNKFNLNLGQCLMIGDSNKDILAAQASSIDSIFLKTEYNSIPSNGFVVNSLLELL